MSQHRTVGVPGTFWLSTMMDGPSPSALGALAAAQEVRTEPDSDTDAEELNGSDPVALAV